MVINSTEMNIQTKDDRRQIGAQRATATMYALLSWVINRVEMCICQVFGNQTLDRQQKK